MGYQGGDPYLHFPNVDIGAFLQNLRDCKLSEHHDAGVESDMSDLTDVEYDEGEPSNPLPTTATSSPPAPTAGHDGPSLGSHNATQQAPLSGSHRRRKAKRQKRFREEGRLPRAGARQSVLAASAMPVEVSWGDAPSRVAEGSYVASTSLGQKRGKKRGRKHGKKCRTKQGTPVYTKADLLEMGLREIEWDGMYVPGVLHLTCVNRLLSTPTPLTVGPERRIVAILAGRAPNAPYEAAIAECTKVMDRLSNMQFNSKYTRTPRNAGGASLHNGISMGNGMLKPGYVAPSEHAELVKELQAMQCFRTLAGYGDGVLLVLTSVDHQAYIVFTAMFQTWAPDLYCHYVSYLKPLFQHHPELEDHRPYPNNSVYPSATYNVGPSVSTKHLDPLNLPHGLCDDASLGNYDPVRGGHLVLWDLGVFIQFPPGSHILFPSAIVYHSNAQIQEYETRHSFVQYCSGGLFRWVDAGYRLQKQLDGNEKEAYLEHRKQRRDRIGMSLFSTLDDLKASCTHTEMD
jgi:hypothetical protein